MQVLGWIFQGAKEYWPVRHSCFADGTWWNQVEGPYGPLTQQKQSVLWIYRSNFTYISIILLPTTTEGEKVAFYLVVEGTSQCSPMMQAGPQIYQIDIKSTKPYQIWLLISSWSTRVGWDPGDESIRPQFSPQKNVFPEPFAALAFLSRKWCYPRVYVIDQQACQNWSEKMGEKWERGIIFLPKKNTSVTELRVFKFQILSGPFTK